MIINDETSRRRNIIKIKGGMYEKIRSRDMHLLV